MSLPNRLCHQVARAKGAELRLFDALFILKSQSAGGTNTHAFPAFLASEFTNWLVTKSGDHSLEATVGKAQDTYSEMLPAYP